MRHFIIYHDHAGSYALFYSLAFLVGFIVLLWEGRRRKFPIIPWMMVVTTAFLFFMAGCRMITFSIVEWSYVFRLESISYIPGRSVLGGIIFATAGVLLAKRLLGFRQDMMDAFAFVLPIGIAVQRFGCLLAGCCYGRPGELPWAIQYEPGSFAFNDQVKEGLLSSNSVLSMPVHPVQVYEAICALIIISLLLKMRKHLHTAGNLFLTSVGLYGAFRFLLEFIRASHGENNGFLNQVQWLILAILPLLLLFIISREKTNYQRRPSGIPIKQGIFRPTFYFILMALIFMLVSRWLGTLEIISLNIVLLPLLAMLAWHLFKSVTIPRWRIATLILPVASLILMSQTIVEQPQEGKKLTYTTFSAGMMSGSTDLTDIERKSYASSYYDNNCNTVNGNIISTVTTTNSVNHYATGALGIAHTIAQDRYKNFTYGVNLFSGSHTEGFSQSIATNDGTNNGYQYSSANNSYSYYGIKPYLQHNEKKFGFGLGASIGQMRQLEKDSPANMKVHNSWSTQSSAEYLQVVPAFSLRIGNLSKFFLDYRYCNQFAATFPVLTHQVAFGFPLDKKGSLVRMGSGSYAKYFIAPSIRAGDNFIIEPYVGFGGNSNPDNKSDSFIGSINLHYKFNKKEKALN